MTANELQELDQRCTNTLRTLAIDQVQKANAGHPGTPMGAAPTAYCLWQRFMRFDPEDAAWPDRDRFVLSVGHASALLYGLLHLCGVKAATSLEPARKGLAVEMADLQSFRQAGSRCTGHPEHGWTTGVETTTGPLGQGVATSVGMAIAQAWLGATYNRPGFALFEHRVFALAGDGDMMEGLSAEAASLAGHLKLNRLCWIYDSNHISIEGPTAITLTENVSARFIACGWQVLQVADANDIEATALALRTFEHTLDRPTLIVVQSHIGYGAPHKQDSAAAHGEPLGVEESRGAKAFYGFDPDASFAVPDGVREHLHANFAQRGTRAHKLWCARFAAYRAQYPDLAEQIDQMQQRELPEGWDAALPVFEPDAKGLATRDASGQVLNAVAAHVPWLLGGAADLAPSTKTTLIFDFAGAFEPASHAGRNFHFGIREHAMCAAVNGMALSGLRPFAASFFVFSDYARGAIRLAAMMGLPVVCVWTHDSIAMGEDGPTHQPIEQLASFRAMPGMVTLRPADANEVVEAWRVVMRLRDRPASLVLSRQALPTLDRTRYASAAGVARGAYVLADAPDGRPDVLLLASGSEVALCIAAYEQLTKEGVKARVVSMPSWDLFERQDPVYREQVLPESVTARVSVEAASPLGWDRYVGRHGTVIAMHGYGLSAPGPVVQAHFGFDVAHVLDAVRDQLAWHGRRPIQ
ncbi:transketolase [Hydrogenophaga sp. PAMC20947]|uniref:transketolase n=1 Tax=Hydrogenophaga sp. PAMC20947 TaxID=2565558 RepID=UPI00109DA868|nr:transketolase [Hydrogenophaga sp. PAMC20947]QCB45409.1 transketolase [Hydrogenophaga sp. PAMC20947]